MNEKPVVARVVEAYKLPPRLCELLLSLIDSPLVPSKDVNAVLMHRLRKDVKEYGVTINSKRGVGYWLPDESRTTIQQRIAG